MRCLTVVIFAGLSALALAQCRIDGSAGLLLDIVRDANGNVTCLPGFYCPNLDPANASTYPVACTASPQCQVDRLFSKTCSPPEIYEPRICKEGYYCPVYNLQLECPSGKFCPEGTAKPIKCEIFAFCPSGSEKPTYLGGFLFTGIGAALLTVLIVMYHKKLRLRAPDHDLMEEKSHAPDSAEGAGLVEADGGQEMTTMKSNRSWVDEISSTSVRTICDAFAKARGDRPPIRLDASGLRVQLPEDLGGKVLLRGVSGCMRPGKVTAIMGPSGAGKTVFMTTLLGNVSHSWPITGDLRVNGRTVELGSMRQHIAFVPQDDVLHTELSVDANLYYSSEVRLPPSWSAEERSLVREAIIERLGLAPRRSMATNTLSASQRKLCSVAVELCAAPQVLFLDEPTSGLDSTTSLELVRLLKELAVAAQLTVVMVVHQPRVEIWDELDEVLLLAPGGMTVYQGAQKHAASYFAGHNVTVRPQDNSADVLMDAIAEKADELVDSWAKREEDDDPSLPGSAQVPLGALDVENVMPKASFVRQFCLSHMRSIEKQLTVLSSLAIELVVSGLTGVLIAYSVRGMTLAGTYIQPYNRVSPIPDLALFPQVWMYLVHSLGLSASVAGVNMFGRERQQYFREAQTGYSRVAYFLGNATSSVYRVVFSALVFTTLLMSVGVLPARFAVVFPAVMLTYGAYYGVATCVSVVVSPAINALMATLLSIMVGSFNGFIDFPEGLKQIFFSFHLSQIIQEELARHIDHWAQKAMGDVGYASGRAGLSFSVILIWILVAHALALGLMIFTHRDKQK